MSEQYITGSEAAAMLYETTGNSKTQYRKFCRLVESGQIEKYVFTTEERNRHFEIHKVRRDYMIPTSSLISYMNKQIRDCKSERDHYVKKVRELYRG